MQPGSDRNPAEEIGETLISHKRLGSPCNTGPEVLEFQKQLPVDPKALRSLNSHWRKFVDDLLSPSGRGIFALRSDTEHWQILRPIVTML